MPSQFLQRVSLLLDRRVLHPNRMLFEEGEVGSTMVPGSNESTEWPKNEAVTKCYKQNFWALKKDLFWNQFWIHSQVLECNYTNSRELAWFFAPTRWSSMLARLTFYFEGSLWACCGRGSPLVELRWWGCSGNTMPALRPRPCVPLHETISFAFL